MKQIIQTKLTLVLPTDKVIVPLQIVYDNDEDEVNPISEISLVYNNIKYQGNGTNFLWMDTFADLQRKLPHDVKLACCMTCRHGNMCPYGNRANLLFCTKDVQINNKIDMCNVYNESIVSSSNREVSSFNYCDDFIYQTDDYYTYNDYLFYLQEKE